jgi:hypothetical protein
MCPLLNNTFYLHIDAFKDTCILFFDFTPYTTDTITCTDVFKNYNAGLIIEQFQILYAL